MKLFDAINRIAKSLSYIVTTLLSGIVKKNKIKSNAGVQILTSVSVRFVFSFTLLISLMEIFPCVRISAVL